MKHAAIFDPKNDHVFSAEAARRAFGHVAPAFDLDLMCEQAIANVAQTIEKAAFRASGDIRMNAFFYGCDLIKRWDAHMAEHGLKWTGFGTRPGRAYRPTNGQKT